MRIYSKAPTDDDAPKTDARQAARPTDPRGEPTKWGIGGATLGESALNLRLVFAVFGFLLFSALAGLSVTYIGDGGTGAYAWPIALSAIALFALINVIVIVWRRRQRARDERRRLGHEIHHGVFG